MRKDESRVAKAPIISVAELEQAVGNLHAADVHFPTRVSEIHGFPYPSFSVLCEKVREGECRLEGSSVYQEPQLMTLFAPRRMQAIYFASMAATSSVPLVALAAGFNLSWWWFLFGLLCFPLGMRLTSALYRAAIFHSALSSEEAFCLLFYASQFSVVNRETGERISWGRIADDAAAFDED